MRKKKNKRRHRDPLVFIPRPEPEPRKHRKGFGRALYNIATSKEMLNFARDLGIGKSMGFLLDKTFPADRTTNEEYLNIQDITKEEADYFRWVIEVLARDDPLGQISEIIQHGWPGALRRFMLWKNDLKDDYIDKKGKDAIWYAEWAREMYSKFTGSDTYTPLLDIGLAAYELGPVIVSELSEPFADYVQEATNDPHLDDRLEEAGAFAFATISNDS